MTTRSGLRRERAIIAVLRTGRIPGQNVTRLEFCDLVRTAARVRQAWERFPRECGVPRYPGNRHLVLHAFGEHRGEGSLADGWLRRSI
jgi:hypothetical protein